MGQYSKTIRVSAPNVSTNYVAKPAVYEKSYTLSFDGPRVGQTWQIDSAYFSFPAKARFLSFTNQSPLSFGIRLRVGGQEIAEQVFTASISKEAEESAEHEQAIPFVGNLEAFAPPVAYPGEGIELEYTAGEDGTGSFGRILSTEQGLIVISYTLIIPDKQPRPVR